MKKIFALAFAASMAMAVVSCGPSAAEKKADSLKVDSTAKSMNNDADSMIAMMNRQNDSTAKADKEKAVADSIRKADSAMKAKKK